MAVIRSFCFFNAETVNALMIFKKVDGRLRFLTLFVDTNVLI